MCKCHGNGDVLFHDVCRVGLPVNCAFLYCNNIGIVAPPSGGIIITEIIGLQRVLRRPKQVLQRNTNIFSHKTYKLANAQYAKNADVSALLSISK